LEPGRRWQSGFAFEGRAAPDRAQTRSTESHLAFGGAYEDKSEEVATPTRQFTVWETTSGLPDDSREADARTTARQLRDLRGRVKAARATLAATPGLAEVLQSDWKRAAGFYAHFGITESQFRSGVPSGSGRGEPALTDSEQSPWLGSASADRGGTV
jgi:hypothetical protein